MEELTEEGRMAVDDLAQRHGVSADAVLTLLRAIVAGNGMQAQFNHHELGGMGQWSQGGMIMIGDMFNNALKYRVDGIATELANLLRGPSLFQPAAHPARGGLDGREGVSLFVPGASGFSSGNWPAELGRPGSTGAQNDLHYAYFPDSQRLAIRKGGHITLYDTGEHSIGGFSQQQGDDQSLTFTSQHGSVRVSDLPVVAPLAAGVPGPPPAAFESAWAKESGPEPARPPARAAEDNIFDKIERLADLRTKGILTEAEFQAKKTELLSRL